MKRFGLNVIKKLPLLRKAFEKSREDMHCYLDMLEIQLGRAGDPWILGRQFTLADVSWLVILERLRQVDALDVFVNPFDRPACRAWWSACTARPSYHTAITAHEHPVVVHGTRRLQAMKAADAGLRAFLEGAPWKSSQLLYAKKIR